MTLEEFSNEFDVLVDSYRRFKKFDDREFLDSLDFNEYEKSVFLTKAQEEIIIELYSGKNIFNNSFEKTEELRRNLNSLVKTYKTSNKEEGQIGLSDKSVFFKLPEDLWFITYESVTLQEPTLSCIDGKNIIVIPTTQDEYYRTEQNPFKTSNERRILRLDISDNTVELVSKYNIKEYIIRYLSKPLPIILEDLPEALQINGENKKSECSLNSVIHRTILDRAVTLAIASKVPSTQDNKK